MTKKFDLAVFIGRFQPAHKGHLQVIRDALEHSDKLLILLGSANIGRTTRNPFTYYERNDMLMHVLETEQLLDRVHLCPLNDHPYDLDEWLAEVQQRVSTSVYNWGLPEDASIVLTGHHRDESTFYLHKFPQWGFFEPTGDVTPLNASRLRQLYFHESWVDVLHEEKEWLLAPTLNQLNFFRDTPIFRRLKSESEYETQYRKDWGPGPFQTADSVIIHSGHILTVERKKNPGILALPGGFINVDETVARAAVRETFEETALFADTQNPEDRSNRLWAGYRGRRRFDEPHRDQRARIITEAFLFKLSNEGTPLPEVRGEDDALKAQWIPLVALQNPENFFADHGFIASKLLRSYA